VSDYLPMIGLEIHAQLLTQTKMFCACPAAYGGPSNVNVCPVCLGFPGALPVVNARAVELGVKTAIALDCAIAQASVFARKNYFYPDCPKNYQITQYERPLATGGYLLPAAGKKAVRIKRIHLEEDAGKLLHPEGEEASYVDMNRAGVPLVEIVTEPDIESPADASLFVQTLRSILRYLAVCDGNMEEGSLRCDANVSLKKPGSHALGVSTEIKNLNSFKFIEHALEYEIRRQTAVLDEGGRVERATLLWDDAAGRCEVMRTKEETQDYRYFPEPDVRPLEVPGSLIEHLRGEVPELPGARAERFVSEYGVPPSDAIVLTEDRALADYFEAAAVESGDAPGASRWIVGEVLREFNDRRIGVAQFKISPAGLSRLMAHLSQGRINLPTAKDIFRRMAETGEEPDRIIAQEGLERITDERVITGVVERVLDRYPGEVTAYLGGKERLFTYFVGEAMKETGGRADPKILNDILRSALGKRRFV
jgi:aspartyl-tRNA(Asn)/glutamyl-tRNA(Gln) amidotransferase subunit B